MAIDVGKNWRSMFNDVVQRRQDAAALKEASMHGPLRQWTQLLTGSVVETCEKFGWSASAIGHKLELLPIAQSEYLAIDIMAFGDGDKRWRFPKAVIEPERQPYCLLAMEGALRSSRPSIIILLSQDK